MIELLIVYLVLGSLAALSQGQWRLRALARAILIWPALLPGMIRSDPSPLDPPGLAVWEGRIRGALTSLQDAVAQSDALPDQRAGQLLLVDAQENLEAIARRHAELDALLAQPGFDLAAIRADAAQAPAHRLPALVDRTQHIERMFAAREVLETQLEAGLARVMNLAAQLHLARATDAPVRALQSSLEDIAAVVGGVVEAEELVGAELGLPEGWSPQLAPAQPASAAGEPRPLREPASAAGEPRPLREPASAAERAAFEQRFAPADALLPAAPPPRPVAQAGAPTRTTEQRARAALIGGIVALALGSALYRALAMGGLEQSAALFIGLPAFLAVVVALLPRPRSYTGVMLKVITLMLLLSGVLLAEGFICIVMAAPLFYAVGIFAGAVLDLTRKRSATTRVLALTWLLLPSLEGVHPALSFPRAESVTVQRTLSASPGTIAAALAAPPRLTAPLPLFLRLGFPLPVRALGSGLAVGDRRVIGFAGGEGEPGMLVMEVWDAAPGRVVFGVIEDTSHIAHWLTWRSAEVTWQDDGAGGTAVTWTLHYERALDPALWFAPMERHAVGLAAGYLTASLEGEHVL